MPPAEPEFDHAPEELIIRRDRLIAVSNEIAQILVDSNVDDFPQRMWDVFHLLGSTLEVDRVYIWKNYREADGELYMTQIYEWSPGAEPQQGNALTVGISFREAAPVWGEILSAGKCVNSLVRDLPELERNHLTAQGIISILVAPIIFKGEFWGFIGFDDCSKERSWSEAEVAILMSTAILIAAAIKRQKTEEALAAERATLQEIFASSPIGVAITTEGILRSCNSRYKDLTQVEIGDSIVPIYYDADDRRHYLELLEKRGVVYNRPMRVRRKDGLTLNVLVTYLNIMFEGERSALCWMIDVTDLMKTEKALLAALEMAQSGTKAKNEFLARMSHEIRTPMNAILGMVYLCMQTQLSDQQRNYLQKTHQATNHLLGIIDDVLDFSNMESGRLELENSTFRLSGIIEEVVDHVSFEARSKNLAIEIGYEQDLCDLLIGDPIRIRQILNYLVGNAVKFTEQGTISISVKTLTEDTAESVTENIAKNAAKANSEDRAYPISFTVRDTGIGMNAEQLEKLFMSFSQADGSTSRKYGGTGLGLVIAKNLIELMDGTIQVQSEPGVGTSVTFTLLLHRAETMRNEISDVDFKQCHVLVADDDPVMRDLLKNYLLSLDMRVETVQNGFEAVESLNRAAAESDPFEVLLVDWKMPRMDGIETIRQIRLSEQIKAPPQILMISAYDRSEGLRQSRNLGVAGFLIKPISRDALAQAMAQVIKHEKNKSLDFDLEKEKHDIRGAKVLLVEDNRINQMVATELLEASGVELTIANNGLEALEVIKHLDFDLVLMDIQMPIMDGLEATEKIRKLDKPGIGKLPIIAMTANAMDEDYRRSLEVGMNDHLTKPIDPEKLRRAMETWIVR